MNKMASLNDLNYITMMNHGLVVVIGGQAGSEGKGKFAGWYANNQDKHPHNFVASVANFMPNAGHTWVSDDGEKVMVQQLPQACINPELNLYISAGSAIEVELLLDEIERYNIDTSKIKIHPRAVIIEQQHRDMEKVRLNSISSTLKGCGYAAADKIVRSNSVKLAADSWELQELNLVVTQSEFEDAIYEDLKRGDILVEAPQGYDLDINHGLQYPYCTSRQTSATQAVADAGLPFVLIKEVIAVIRPYPIRVGNATDEQGNMVGYSGDYADSQELTWEEIAKRSGTPYEEINELTTVTKKIRRVFEIDKDRLGRMARYNGAVLALNFANYIDYAVKGKSDIHDMTKQLLEFVIELEQIAPVILIGTGAKDSEIISMYGIEYKDMYEILKQHGLTEEEETDEEEADEEADGKVINLFDK